jgi:thiol-disulfide isomerase/thioredoxin
MNKIILINKFLKDNYFNLILILITFITFYFLYKIYNNTNYDKFSNSKIKIYNFNTLWCKHSINFQPIWNSFVQTLVPTDSISSFDVKCDNNQNNNLVKKYDVKGFPTIIIDTGSKVINYSGPRTINGLRNALNLQSIIDNTIQIPLVNTNIKCGHVEKSTKSDNSTIIYNFNTSNCGYSVRFQPTWDQFADTNVDPNIKIIDVKCDNNQNNEICNKYDIEGYPTVLKINKDLVTIYDGPRTLDGLLAFSKK